MWVLGTTVMQQAGMSSEGRPSSDDMRTEVTDNVWCKWWWSSWTFRSSCMDSSSSQARKSCTRNFV